MKIRGPPETFTRKTKMAKIEQGAKEHTMKQAFGKQTTPYSHGCSDNKK